MQWYIEPLHGDDGSVSHFVAIQRDVTREREQSRQQRVLEQAISQLADFAVLFDRRGTVQFTNLSYLRWSGLRPAEALEQSVWELPGAPRRHGLSWARRVLSQGTAWRQQYSVESPTGPCEILVTVSPITDDRGEMVFLAVGRSLT